MIQNGDIYGSYIHGIFDEKGIAREIVRVLYERKGLEFNEENDFDIHSYKETQYDLLAKLTRESVDMDMIYKILEEGL